MSNGAENLTVRIFIESLDPPSGHGSVDQQKPWSFTGWLELMEKVEEIRWRRDPRSMRRRRIGGASSVNANRTSRSPRASLDR